MHESQHPLAGTAVRFNGAHRVIHNTMGDVTDMEFRIEDWWDHLTGTSWGSADGNPAALVYAIRGAVVGLPLDDEVLYGHIAGLGMLVHVTEVVA